MLAAYASAVGGDDPLANLTVGELPAPEPRPGWALVRVRAASLNHHDIWTLRGVSSAPVTPPQILGCDAAGEVDCVRRRATRRCPAGGHQGGRLPDRHLRQLRRPA